MWRTLKKILKVILLGVLSFLIGIIPSYLVVFAGSCLLMLFGIAVTEILGNVIVFILAFAIGAYIIADTIG